MGSILPAYFLVKVIAGVDVRSVGTKHAGTTNVYRTVGLWPAMVTAFYDTTKGILAVQISKAMGQSDSVALLSGYFAVIGHVFPFCLQFRGGKGAATSVGLLLFFLWNTWLKFPIQWFLSDLFVLLSLVLVLLWSSRKGDVVGTFVLPALGLILSFRGINHLWFLWIIVGTLWMINLRNVLEERAMKLGEAGWRVLIRPAAFLLLLLSLKMEKEEFLLLVMVVFSIFLLADISRLISRRVHRFFHEELEVKIYRSGERKKISSMTLFLLGVLLSFLLFEKEVSFTAGCFLIFGDMTAKIVGISFGKKRLFHKSLEGTITALVVNLFVAYMIFHAGLMDFFPAFLGSVVATTCEVLPLSIDDRKTSPARSFPSGEE
ncbi:glycerol-3-phosphate acyltransferase [Thermotoga sp.]|uniref:glycerol-3-phosphate acyltransferase n=1 Tax=Thermotoga sp. TaxID=28240 RepID=UPI0025DFC440|nr:glycerol-3-phosphate acyltransferase [Thermotoga sp.]